MNINIECMFLMFIEHTLKIFDFIIFVSTATPSCETTVTATVSCLLLPLLGILL